MNQKFFIGLAGPAGCGKGTAAGLMTTIWNTETTFYGNHLIQPLASELKRIAKDEFGWDGNKDERGRRLLQVLGTECGRVYGGDDFWVNKWNNKVSEWIKEIPDDENCLIICDDIRFDNEAQHIKDLGGRIIRISGRAYDMGSNQNHPSEKGISDNLVDKTIYNYGSILDLKNILIKLMKQYQII